MEKETIRPEKVRREDVISIDTRLPTEPSALPHLLQAFSEEDVDVHKLADIIERYPSIAVRLISLANSAWSAPRTPIARLDRACTHLGLRLVRSVSISLAVASPFNTMRCPTFDPQRFWCSTFLVADGAEWLTSCAQGVTGLDSKTVQTAGLLHNLGLLWLADNKPQEATEALKVAMADDAISVNQALQQMGETDLCEIGGHLGRAWALPDDLVAAMQHHCNPGYDGGGWRVATLVGSAAAMVGALYRNEECPVEERGADILGTNRADREQIFSKLAGELEDTRELAQSLFA